MTRPLQHGVCKALGPREGPLLRAPSRAARSPRLRTPSPSLQTRGRTPVAGAGPETGRESPLGPESPRVPGRAPEPWRPSPVPGRGAGWTRSCPVSIAHPRCLRSHKPRLGPRASPRAHCRPAASPAPDAVPGVLPVPRGKGGFLPNPRQPAPPTVPPPHPCAGPWVWGQCRLPRKVDMWSHARE